MREFLTLLAVAAVLGIGFAIIAQMAAPSEYEQEPQEPEMCIVATMTDGSVFTDYGGKSLLVIKSNGEVDVYEEAEKNRRNCIE